MNAAVSPEQIAETDLPSLGCFELSRAVRGSLLAFTLLSYCPIGRREVTPTWV